MLLIFVGVVIELLLFSDMYSHIGVLTKSLTKASILSPLSKSLTKASILSPLQQSSETVLYCIQYIFLRPAKNYCVCHHKISLRSFAGKLPEKIFIKFYNFTNVLKLGVRLKHFLTCRKLILGRGIGWGCRCATSWCDLPLNFELAEIPLSLKILTGLYLINRKM